MRAISLSLLAALILLTTPVWAEQTAPLTLYASTYPLSEFSQRIGGEKVNVKSILPPGADAHDYEPTARQMLEITRADIFVYNGAGFELWIHKLLKALEGDHQLTIVNTTEGMDLLAADDDHHHHDHSHGFFSSAWGKVRSLFGHHHHHHHDHGPDDPHVWLDPTLALQQAQKIHDTLIQLQPEHAPFFSLNFQHLKDELLELDRQYTESLRDLTNRHFVVPHKAFSYLAERYDLEQIAIAGVHPGSEPSQREVMAIIDFLRANDIGYVFFETTVSNRVAQTIATETGAQTLVLNPIENLRREDLAAGQTYFSLMRKNLENLLIALK